MTYEQLQMSGLPSLESTERQSRYCQRDFRASLTALREKVSAIVMSVTSGEKWQELSERFARAGLSAKILPVCLPELIKDTSSEYLPTLPRWGIASGGEYGELVTSERRIGGTECSLFPTPLASDAIRIQYSEESLRKVGLRKTQGEYKKAGCNLSEWVAVFPTPQATSWGCTGARQKLKKAEENGIITEAERKGMQAGNVGKLNPTWVEWLMGFPTGWTDLDV